MICLVQISSDTTWGRYNVQIQTYGWRHELSNTKGNKRTDKYTYNTYTHKFNEFWNFVLKRHAGMSGAAWLRFAIVHVTSPRFWEKSIWNGGLIGTKAIFRNRSFKIDLSTQEDRTDHRMMSGILWKSGFDCIFTTQTSVSRANPWVSCAFSGETVPKQSLRKIWKMYAC